MAYRPRLDRIPTEGRNFVEIHSPKERRCVGEARPPFVQMMRFAEEVREAKPNVERRISKVNNLVVQENKFAPIDKSVLWTEVAVNQAQFVPQRLLGQCLQKTGRCGSVLGGVAVIRPQSQAVEIRSIGKRFAKFRPGFCGLAVDSSKKRTELLEVIRNNPPRQ